MKTQDATAVVALLLVLAASGAMAQTGQSGRSATQNNATQNPAAPVFNPNSDPNPNPNSSPTNPVGNPPSPVGGTPTNPAGTVAPPASTTATNPAGSPAMNPAGSPATSPAGAPAVNPGAGTTIGMNQNGAANNSTQVFLALDPMHKGYLSAADVASNKFLATNFQRCDTNGDGRLTQAETTLCLQSAPPSQQ